MTDDLKQEKPIDIPIPKANKDTGIKPKTKIKKTSTATSKQDLTEIKNTGTALLQGAFSILSIRLGEHWNITEQESKSIVNPCINILDKYDIFNKVAKNVDVLSLIVAVGTVIIPRIILTIPDNKEVTKNETNNIREINRNETYINPESANVSKTLTRDKIQSAIL